MCVRWWDMSISVPGQGERGGGVGVKVSGKGQVGLSKPQPRVTCELGRHCQDARAEESQ